MSNTTPEPAAKTEPRYDAFTHLLHVDGVEFDVPFEIFPGHRIVRASEQQAQDIRESIIRLQMWPTYQGHFVIPYEGHQPGEPCHWQGLPPDQWKYFVVEHDRVTLVHHLPSVGSILGTSIFDLGATVSHADFGRSTSMDQVRLAMTFQEPLFARALTVEDVSSWQAANALYKVHDHDLYDLRPFVHELQDLKRLPPHSKLGFLGYFAVLERAVTHMPERTDPYDSITRQVKVKMALLSNRAKFTPTYAEHFGALTNDRVWTLMYKYRSAIAHGGTADFKNDLKQLKSAENALHFLKRATAMVLYQALQEPLLLRDLKQC